MECVGVGDYRTNIIEFHIVDDNEVVLATGLDALDVYDLSKYEILSLVNSGSDDKFGNGVVA